MIKADEQIIKIKDCGFTNFRLYSFSADKDLIYFYASDLIILQNYKEAIKLLQAFIIED